MSQNTAGMETNPVPLFDMWPNLGYGQWDKMATQAWEYWMDAAQRSVLFWDVMRQRGNIFREHEKRGKPPVLKFNYEMVMEGRELARPVNYYLVRIVPDQPMELDETKRPFVVVDPRAGHGPIIAGSRSDSQIGMALKAGHPCYFMGFHPDPVPGQTIGDVGAAEGAFLEKIMELHPKADGKPCVMANCQAGWAVMGLSAVRPELPGPIILSGSPISYWAGTEGKSPMRYRGGLTGGSWAASLAGDLGNGTFDGAYLVNNFEDYNLANTYWKKQYNLYAQIDTESERYLNFEKWWGGYFLMTTEEIRFIVNSLFVGNKLSSGEVVLPSGEVVDLRRITSPIVVFASRGDEITPPQQALNWILDLYDSVDDIRSHEQTIVYILHEDIGHLGIFVSAKVARREHDQFVQTLDMIDLLVPGLYEMVIERKDGDDENVALVPGDYLARFEARTLDDIRALDDGREDERPFAVAARVSEITEGFYLTFVSPWVKAWTNEVTAEWIRALNPGRMEYTLLSDGNPFLLPLKLWSEEVRADRRPATTDTVLVVAQTDCSTRIAATLQWYQSIRDIWDAWVVKTVYGSPWVEAAVGLRSSSASRARRRADDHAHKELVRLKIAALRSRIEAGGVLEGIVRILMYLSLGEGEYDVRGFRLMDRLAEQYPRTAEMSIDELKTLFREQAFMLLIDEDAALLALTRLLPQEEDRQEALILVRMIASADGEISPVEEARLSKVEAMLGG